jgi:cold shock CspA family protein
LSIKGTITKLVRGYGFIRTEEGRNLFFPHNDLLGVTYDSLTEGRKVELEFIKTSKGIKAVNVRLG